MNTGHCGGKGNDIVESKRWGDAIATDEDVDVSHNTRIKPRMTETHLRSHHVQISRVVTLQPTSTTLT
jgi:hypothetical protein